MFGAETVTKGLTLTKVLSGLNKTLSVANQVIPIYQQAKPMIQNARSVFRLFKEFGGNNPSTITKPKTLSQTKTISKPTKKVSENSPLTSSNQPSFFV